MHIAGQWLVCDDGIIRPALKGQVQKPDGTWIEANFLIDTGADRTVLSAHVWRNLGRPGEQGLYAVEGVGGKSSTAVVPTGVRLVSDAGSTITFKVDFLAVMEIKALDMSVLGRDITNHFALIVDRQQDVVYLVGQGHRYSIVAG
jgi:hypothetical protein